MRHKKQRGGKRNPAFFQTLPRETPKQMKKRLEQEKIDKMYPDGTPYDDDGPAGKEPKNKKSKTMKKKMYGGTKKKMYGGKKTMGMGGRKGKMQKGGAKPDYIDIDKDGNRTESMKKAAMQKGKKPMKMGGDYMEPSKEVKFGGPTKKQTGGTTNYPVYAKGSEQAKSFRKAYAAAADGSTFTWEGRKYLKKAKETSDPKPVAGKPAKTIDTSGSSTMDKVAKGDTSGATKVEASAKAGAKKRDIRRARRQATRATRRADRKSGAAKVSRMESRNVKKVGRIQSRASAKAGREEKRIERKAPRKARKAAIKGAKAQMKANIRAAKGKPDKKILGGLMGAIGGAKGGGGIKGALKGAMGGGMLGRAFGAAKGLAGAIGQGGGLKGMAQGAMQAAAGGAFGNSNPMAQQEEMQQAKRGGMRDRRKAKRQGRRDDRMAKRGARKAKRAFNKRVKNKKVY